MDCHEIVKGTQLVDLALRTGPGEPRDDAERHLAGCKVCAGRVERARRLLALIARLPKTSPIRAGDLVPPEDRVPPVSDAFIEQILAIPREDKDCAASTDHDLAHDAPLAGKVQGSVVREELSVLGPLKRFWGWLRTLLMGSQTRAFLAGAACVGVAVLVLAPNRYWTKLEHADSPGSVPPQQSRGLDSWARFVVEGSVPKTGRSPTMVPKCPETAWAPSAPRLRLALAGHDTSGRVVRLKSEPLANGAYGIVVARGSTLQPVLQSRDVDLSEGAWSYTILLVSSRTAVEVLQPPTDPSPLPRLGDTETLYILPQTLRLDPEAGNREGLWRLLVIVTGRKISEDDLADVLATLGRGGAGSVQCLLSLPSLSQGNGLAASLLLELR